MKKKVRNRLSYNDILKEIKGAVGRDRYRETYPLIKVLASRILEEQQYWFEIEPLLEENLNAEDFKRREALSKSAANMSRTIKQLFEVIGFTPLSEGDKMDEFDKLVKKKVGVDNSDKEERKKEDGNES